MPVFPVVGDSLYIATYLAVVVIVGAMLFKRKSRATTRKTR